VLPRCQKTTAALEFSIPKWVVSVLVHSMTRTPLWKTSDFHVTDNLYFNFSFS
jgi:hypothetical protein